VELDKQNGLLKGVVYHCSPNQDARPDKTDITGIVIHNISLPPGEFGGGWIDDLFLNQLDPKAHPYFETISEMKVALISLVKLPTEIRSTPVSAMALTVVKFTLPDASNCAWP